MGHEPGMMQCLYMRDVTHAKESQRSFPPTVPSSNGHLQDVYIKMPMVIQKFVSHVNASQNVADSRTLRKSLNRKGGIIEAKKA